ncbi:MAG TPA: chitobiase/beta-hexosaminidase C-terminal domain-containing protein [Candidatus Dormibacteraeota bacterium]|nr:chitobiase/beta-hexosaminidase C-terminal domain-containing protein [Candidatus Dormibacteraeota bacterium]
MSRSFRTVAALVFVGLTVLLPAPRCEAASRTFQSLTISPATTNIVAGTTVSISATITVGPNSGTGEYGDITNTVSILSAEPTVTASIQPNFCTVNAGASSNLTVTVHTAASTPANTYTGVVVVAATPTNSKAGTPITNTFTVTVASGQSDSYSLSISPASTSVFRNVAGPTNVLATVTFVDRSATLFGTVTNGVTVSPSGLGVTAALNSNYAPITNDFGQTNLVLTVSVAAGASNGNYTITVKGTNSAFTANSPPGVASALFALNLRSRSQFTLGMARAAETLTGGSPTNYVLTVGLTNLSVLLAEPITCGVTVIAPDTNVTAGLSATSATASPNGGSVTLALSITNNSNIFPGAYTYQVIVGAMNSDYADNTPIPGIALVTNSFTVISPPLSFRQFSLSNATLNLHGTGGGPNWPFVVVASTNLMLALPQWTPILTNAFDTSGNFSAALALTKTLAPNASHQFFALTFPSSTTPVATPVFSPAARAYLAETPVSITSGTADAIIRFTTDGSTPSETNGTRYVGPVTMRGPVNTNSTGIISNASGVTMLKAVAYKAGMPASPVWTGIYTILDPVAYPPASVASPLIGVAHMAYNVSSSNWDSTFALWTNYYGFAPVASSNDFALIKINDQQFIEMYRVSLLFSNQWQLANYGFEVTNAEAYRQQLAAAGLAVPAGVTTNALGNLSFFTVDPDGHTNEWVQYLATSITGQSQGRFMPGSQLVGFVNDVGILTSFGSNNVISGPPITYYVDQCGFQGSGNTLDSPSGGKVYIELLTAGPGGATQDTAGKHGKIQFMNFRGMDIFQTINILTNRNPSIVYLLAPEGRHYAFDVDTPDLSRIRINDF